MQLLDYWRIIKERRKIVLLAFFATIVMTLGVSLLLPVQYESTATIMLDFDSSNPMNMNMATSQTMTSSATLEYINTQTEIIKSRRIAEGVIDILSLDKAPGNIVSFNKAKDKNPLVNNFRRWLADSLLSSLKVIPLNSSRFLHIKFYSADPSYAAAVANAFAKSYNNYNLELKVSPYKDAENWFSEKLKYAKGHSDKSSEHLRTYQQKQGIISQQGAVYDDALKRLELINNELAIAKAKLYETSVALKRLESSNGNYESLPEIISNLFIQGIKTEKIKLETQLTELSGKAGTKHPQYMRLKSMLEALNAKLNNEMQTVVSALRQDNVSAAQRVNSLESAVSNLKTQSTATNLSRFEMDSLTRESEASKQAYDQVLKKFSESSMQSDINRTNVFLVDPAVPAVSKHSPNIMRNLKLSVIVGLLLGLVLAFFFNYLDDTINNPEILEHQFGLAVLGIITTREN